MATWSQIFRALALKLAKIQRWKEKGVIFQFSFKNPGIAKKALVKNIFFFILELRFLAVRRQPYNTLLEICHQVFFRKTLDFSMENEFLLPECQFEMEKQIRFTRAFFAFPGFSKKKISK